MLPFQKFKSNNFLRILVVVFCILALTVILASLREDSSKYRLHEVPDVDAQLVGDNSAQLVNALTDAKQTTWLDVGAGESVIRASLPRRVSLKKMVLVTQSETSKSVEQTISIALIKGSERHSANAKINRSTDRIEVILENSGEEADEVIVKINSSENLRIKDTFFYSSSPRSTVSYLLNATLVYPRSLMAYLFYALLFGISIILTGQIFVRRATSDLDSIESMAAAYVFGLIFYAVVGLGIISLDRIYPLSHTYWLLLFIVWNCFAVCRLIKLKAMPRFTGQKILLTIAVAYLVFIICWFHIYEGGLSGRIATQNDLYFDNSLRYQASIQPYQSDQVFPYNNAKSYYYGDKKLEGDYDETLSKQLLQSRPQFFPIFAQPFLKAFGDRFFIFNALSIAIMPMIVLATYLITAQIFNRKTAILAGAIVPMSYYLLFVAGLTQIKYLTVILATLFYYFLVRSVKNRNSSYAFLASLTGSMMLLIHYYTVIYIFGGLLYLLINKEKSWQRAMSMTFLPVICLLIWLLAIGGESGMQFVGTVTSGDEQSIISKIQNRYFNIIGLFVSNPFPEIWDRVIGYYKLTLPGMTSFSVLVIFLYTLRKRFSELKFVFLALIVAPIALTIAGNGEYTLFGIQLYFIGFIPITYAVAADGIHRLNAKLKIVVLNAVIFEWIFITFVYYRNEITVPFINSITSQPAVSVVTGFLLVLSVMLLCWCANRALTTTAVTISEPYDKV